MIKKLLVKWHKKLKIKEDIFWTNDFSVFTQFTNPKFKEKEVFGAITKTPKGHLIFLKKGLTKSELEHTIVHELIHLKNPKLSDSKVESETEKFFK